MIRTRSILALFVAQALPVLAAEPTPLTPLPGEPAIAQVQAVEPIPATAVLVADPAPTYYGRKEFLFWWYTAPNPTPILTTGDPQADQRAGILGGPSTRTLYGGNDIDLSAFYGARLIFGYWEPQRRFGIEAGLFALGRQTNEFFAGSNAASTPFLAVPFFSGLAAAENRFLLANSGGNNNLVNGTPGLGRFAASYQSQLAGVDVTGMLNYSTGPQLRVDLLGGFAFRGLYENLKLNYTLPETGGGVPDGEEGPNFRRGPLATFGGSAFDQFSTRNNFYGGQVGARANYNVGRMSLDFTGKLAIGATAQQVTINGGSNYISNTPAFFGNPAVSVNQNNPFGVFAQQSNIGIYRQSAFALIPEMTTQLNFQATSRLRLLVGYNFMYWSSVVRPGNQIDRTINRTSPDEDFHFVTDLQSDTPALPGRPAPVFKTSGLIVQGINLGFELQY